MNWILRSLGLEQAQRHRRALTEIRSRQFDLRSYLRGLEHHPLLLQKTSVLAAYTPALASDVVLNAKGVEPRLLGPWLLHVAQEPEQQLGNILGRLEASPRGQLAFLACAHALRCDDPDTALRWSESWLRERPDLRDRIQQLVDAYQNKLAAEGDDMELAALASRGGPAERVIVSEGLREGKLNLYATSSVHGSVTPGPGPYALFLCRGDSSEGRSWGFVVAKDEGQARTWMDSLFGPELRGFASRRLFSVSGTRACYAVPLSQPPHSQRRVFPPPRGQVATTDATDVDYTGMSAVRHYVAGMSPLVYRATVRTPWPRPARVPIAIPPLFKKALATGMYD